MERLLDEISRRELNENFMHNIQSVRDFMEVENGGNGLNLCVQTLDGIMCHNGEMLSNKYEIMKKDKDEVTKIMGSEQNNNNHIILEIR